MEQAFQIAIGRIYQKETPEVNPAYRRFIKRFPCVSCGQTWGIDPCHTGPHAYARKSSDKSCIPLCRKCHDTFDAAPALFAAARGLDIPALIQMFNRFWEQKQQRSAQ
jgi:5-methylcytosine-specific restriction endonuclease McrA